MSHDKLGRLVQISTTCVAILLAAGSPSTGIAQDQHNSAPSTKGCEADNGWINLPPGFCATVFADNLGHARHLVVAPNGVVYVNTWSGRYSGNDAPPGGSLVALQDTDGDGQADVTIRFGDTVRQGPAGGTGIALYKGALYAEVNDRIVRYALPANGIAPTGAPEKTESAFFGKLDPFGDFHLIFGASKLHLKTVEIPIRYAARTYGETNISRFGHGLVLIKMVGFAFMKMKAI
jgi:glucose/arabinose dehydrogenase